MKKLMPPAIAIVMAAASASASSVTVLCIGDSMTAGYNGTSDYDTGYRQPLLDDLTSAGKQIQFIGTYDPTTYTALGYSPAGYSAQLTALQQNHNDGYSGYTTTDLVSNLYGVETPYQAAEAGCLPNMGGYWISGGNSTGRSAEYPDIVLFMAGINDAYDYVPIGDTSTPGTTLGNIASMLAWFNTNRPLTHVVIACPQSVNAGANVLNVINAEANTFPSYIAANYPQDRFLNMIPVVPSYDLSGDGVHPLDSGYALMAQAWANTIAPLIPSGNAYTHTGNAFVFPSVVPSVSGSQDNWQGVFDVSSNDMIVQGGNLATITNQIKSGYSHGTWGGLGGYGATGITSSAAANDTSHLTALAVMQNDNGNGSPVYPTFDGQTSTNSDVLVKYTYVGDANLDGKVDGSDYSLIDNGYLSQSSSMPLTGWANGDFNYDGVIDGSDYTLIDNAFNSQDVALSAGSTAQIATVPEPVGLGLIGLGLLTLQNPARRRSHSR